MHFLDRVSILTLEKPKLNILLSVYLNVRNNIHYKTIFTIKDAFPKKKQKTEKSFV